jgi:superfamily II DNA or RNA helicase
MQLTDHQWKLGRYSSESVHILDECVRPMLRNSMSYSRSVGYLRKSHFNDIGLELLNFIESGGEARYLIGDPLEADVLRSCEEALVGDKERNFSEGVSAKLRQLLQQATQHRDSEDLSLMLLQFLVSEDKLDVRLVLREQGMHHEKIRIASDHVGNTLIAVGSDNDSSSALSGVNKESGTLIANWVYPDTSYWESHGRPYLADFENIWEGRATDSITVHLAEQIKLEIAADWERRGISYGQLRALLEQERKSQHGEKELRDYQELAIYAWQENNFKGVMALCTGAGKTFTTIHASRLLDDKHRALDRSFALIVTVPYKILAHQWCRELSDYFEQVIECWSDNPNWKQQFPAAVFGTFSTNGPRASFAAVVVNDTFQEPSFQTPFKGIPLDCMMFVGDEVHRHGTRRFAGLIPESQYKIGLSATPWSVGEDEREELVKSIYGDVVAEFDIGKALSEGVLCNYHYTAVEMELTDGEAERYAELSSSMAKYDATPPGALSANELRKLQDLIKRRNAILGTSESKLDWLGRYAAKVKKKHSLIYCSEGYAQVEGERSDLKAISRIAVALHESGWDLAKITWEESTLKRAEILDDFSTGAIDGILAIRILDEGFDLPLCRAAFLLSSSKNERQFIQRRGRVLRKSPGKDVAHIYDFLVLPPTATIGTPWAQSLVESEIIRAWEFGRFSLEKPVMFKQLESLCEKWLLDFGSLRENVESRNYISEETD